MQYIFYKSGYKYQLHSDYEVKVKVTSPGLPIDVGYLRLTCNGELLIRRGYAWDGPSGVTVDTLNFMRGSLVHDALYQLMRQQLISKAMWRDVADRELQRICIEDGMSKARASYVYWAVRLFGNKAASKENRRKIERAPK